MSLHVIPVPRRHPPRRDGEIHQDQEASDPMNGEIILDALEGLVFELDVLVAESDGVVGLHLNGDEAPWDELLPGGRYEHLGALTRARSVLWEFGR